MTIHIKTNLINIMIHIIACYLNNPLYWQANQQRVHEYNNVYQVLGCRIDYIATHMYDGDADVIMNQETVWS